MKKVPKTLYLQYFQALFIIIIISSNFFIKIKKFHPFTCCKYITLFYIEYFLLLYFTKIICYFLSPNIIFIQVPLFFSDITLISDSAP